MKAGFFWLIVIIFATCEYSVGQIRYGIKAGVNLSDVVINNYINPDAESDFDFKVGIHGGVFARADLNDKLGSSVELLYSNKGVKAISRINLHYINLPLLVLYKVSDRFTLE